MDFLEIWYQDNKVLIDNILSIALETAAIVGAVVTIAACTFTPVGWAVLGAGLLISASNIIDSGVKIYNYTTTGKEKGFNPLKSGFKAVLGDEVGTMAYSAVSVATGLYNGKGVTIANDAKKFYTSVKSTETVLNKVDDIGDVVNTVNKLEDAGDAAKAVDKLDDVEAARYNDYWNGVADNLAKDNVQNYRNSIMNGEITKPTGGKINAKVITAGVDTNTGEVYHGLVE